MNRCSGRLGESAIHHEFCCIVAQDLQKQLQQAEEQSQEGHAAEVGARDQVHQLQQQITDLQAILASEADRQKLHSRHLRSHSPARTSGPSSGSGAAELQHRIQELEVGSVHHGVTRFSLSRDSSCS